jgi:hypothetical protein
MAELFDDISRIVGSGMPRRRMLRLMAVAFAGGALPASLWPAQAQGVQQCGYQFTIPDMGTFVEVNCSAMTSDQMRDQCIPRCQQTLNSLPPTYASQCPTTCPPSGTSGCSWSCEDGDTLYCIATNIKLSCHCDAPAGQTCCSLGVYCNGRTQKCCGTYCGPIGQTCAGNPTNPR